MRLKEVTSVLSDMKIDFDTISLYSTIDDNGNVVEQNDTFFGTCDISDERGNIVSCTALDHNGDIIQFDALTSLVSGHLGKIAGYF